MRILLAAALLLSTTVLPAQTHKPQPSKAGELRFTLILSRHGIRPPLTEASVINAFASDPWPDWEVPLGHLTPHGADALRRMGAYMRLDFARDGLFPATGCPAPSKIYLYADTDERNVSSSRATFEGFAPGCEALPVHTVTPLQEGSRDPLFSPMIKTFPPLPASARLAALQGAVHNDPESALTARGNPELTELAHILAPDPARPAAKPILDQPVELTMSGNGVTVRGPLASGSNLVEDLTLEYIDDRPMSEVGWGRVDSATLRRLVPLHIMGFGLNTRPIALARPQASNLVAHILDTLDQAAASDALTPREGMKPTPGALGPAGTRLVYISGHDTDLYTIGGMLGLEWTTDGRTNDTPPDSQIVFELWSRPGSKLYDVRIRYRAQTLDQLRSASALTLAQPPGEDLLVPTGCATARACPYETFRKAATSRLDPAYIKADLLPTQVVH